MTLIARDPNTSKLDKYLFNLKDLNFTKTTCSCCPIIPNLNALECLSARGIRWERSHVNEEGEPLICIWISWISDILGRSEYFVDAQGHLGKYQKLEKQGFKLQKLLEVKMKSQSQKSEAKLRKPLCSKVLKDDKILPYASGYCDDHGSHLLTQNNEKFRWNTYREQFEQITCTCNSAISPPLKVSEDCERFMAVVSSGEQRIEVMKSGEKLEKITTMEKGRNQVVVILEAEKVRDLRGRSVEDLRAIRMADQQYHNLRNSWTKDVPKHWNFMMGLTGKPLFINENGDIGVLKKTKTGVKEIRIPVTNEDYSDNEEEDTESSDDLEDSEDSEIDYDSDCKGSGRVKAPESLITREDDGFSVVSISKVP